MRNFFRLVKNHQKKKKKLKSYLAILSIEIFNEIALVLCNDQPTRRIRNNHDRWESAEERFLKFRFATHVIYYKS